MSIFTINIKFILERTKILFINPRLEWGKISLENSDYKYLVKHYLIYIALIPALVYFIGYALIGYRVQFIGFATSYTLGIKLFVYFYLITFISIYLTSFIINYFSPKFGIIKSFNKTFELITYSYITMIFIGILNISPAMSRLVSFLNIYCIYIFFFGFRRMTHIKPEKAFPYFIFNLIVIVGIYFFFWVWLKNEIIINHKAFNI